MKKILTLVLVSFMLSLVGYAKEMNYTIMFKNESTDQTSSISADAMLKFVEDGSAYVSSFSDITNAYAGVSGVKLSSSKKGGSFTANFSEMGTVIPTKIVLHVLPFSSDKATMTLSLNGSDNITDDTEITTEVDVTFKINITSPVTKINIGTNGKRVYVKSITVYYESSKDPAGIAWTDEAFDFTIGVNELSDLPTLDNPNHLSINYSSSSPDVADVSSTGIVTINGIGTTEISAIFVGDDSFSAANVTYLLTIIDPTKIVDVLTYSNTIFDKISYTQSDVYTSNVSNVKYEGYAYKSGGWQFNASKTPRNCIVVTENPNGYVLKSVSIKWKSNSGNQSIAIHGSNTAYTVDGFASEKGDALATFSTDTDFITSNYEFTDSYKYFAVEGTGTSGVTIISEIKLVWDLPATPTPTSYFTFFDEALNDHDVNEIAKDGDDWVANYIELYDDSDYVLEHDVKNVGLFSYDREVSNTNVWHALYLPFYAPNNFNSVISYYGVEEDGEGVALVFEEYTGSTLEPHTVYLVKGGDISFTLDDIALYANPDEDYSVTHKLGNTSYTLAGTYQTLNGLHGQDIYALKDGNFMRTNNENAKVRPFRAYLTVSTVKSAPARVRVKVDGETGIESVSADAVSVDNTTYNMQGIRVENATRGIYVRGGKKIYVK